MARKATKVAVTPDLNEQVAALAYHLWKERGSPAGTPEIDWFKAEQELKAKEQSVPTRSSKKRKPLTTARTRMVARR